MPLVMHVITMNRQSELLRLLSASFEYFDVIRVCNGDYSDYTESVCAMFPNVEYHFKPWRDSTSEQHNHLLEFAKEGEWILIIDDDEVPSPELLNILYQTALMGKQGSQYRMVKIPFSQVYEDMRYDSNFTSERFFLYDGIARFVGNTHYMLDYEHTCLWQRITLECPILHYKTPISYILSDVRSCFIDAPGQGVSQDDINELKSLLPYEVRLSIDLRGYLIKGNISTDVANWIIKHRDKSESVLSRYFYYYFCVLHAEELIRYGLNEDDIGVIGFYQFIHRYYQNIIKWRLEYGAK